MKRVYRFFKNKEVLLRICIIFLVILFILLYIKWSIFKEVINIIIISGILAYILRPVRNLIIGKRDISKRKATLIVILTICIIIIGLFLMIIPMFINELSSSSNIIDKLSSYLLELGNKFKVEESSIFSTVYMEIEEKVWTFTMNFSESLINSMAKIMENIISLAIVPVVAYYFLSDGDRISNKMYLLIPMEKRSVFKKIINDINKLLERYIVSQLLLSIATGLMCLILFSILRLKFAFWLSLINGIFNIVPYFGAFFGGIPAVLIAFIDSPIKGIWVTIGIVLIQQLEGNVLAPKITADSTDVHPLVIIILLLIGEKFGGLAGMILAVPLGVIIKVIYDDVNYYLF